VANGRARFLLTVFGLDGELLALIEADFLGSYRTGAASAVAVRQLGPQVPATVALIGAGWQAATQALALSRVLTIKELRIFSRDKERRTGFANEQAEQLGVEVAAVDTAEAAVRGADVVVTMTTSKSPVIQADWVGPHALVIAAGSNYPYKTELPADLVERAQTVVVDQLAAAQIESGDLIQAHEAGKFDWARAVEFGHVVAGKWKRPEKPGITLFESHGLALWDLAAASTVLPAARKRGMSEELSLL
jgi:ornithine cyclodeaminase/alanine dehydrogenase-like protein (mu-crystallin family)